MAVTGFLSSRDLYDLQWRKPYHRAEYPVGFAIGLPSVVTRGVGSERLQGGAHLGQFSSYRSIAYFEVGARHGLVIRAPNHIGMPLVSPKLKLDFLRRQVLMSATSAADRRSRCSWVG